MHLLSPASTLLLLPLLPLVAHAAPLMDLASCLELKGVPIQVKGSAAFEKTTRPFNLRIKPGPNLAVVPRNLKDVQETARCAGKTKTGLTVKGGGHSYGAYGLAGPLVVDMVSFQDVKLSADKKIASVGAGVRLGNMASKVFELGQRGLPHGTCPGVGIGGHATLGGFGLSSRLWGLTVDQVDSVTAVVGDGSAVTASASKNSDLFYAIRGAGAGFAIVTEFRLKTRPAPPVNINFGYTYNFKGATLGKAMELVQNWGLKNAPKELGIGFLLFPDGSFLVRGVYYGERAKYDGIIASLLAKLKTLHGNKDPSTSVNNLGYIDSLTALAGSPLKTDPANYDEHDTFYVKSIVTKAASPLSLKALTSFANYLSKTQAPAGLDWFLIFNLYGGPGSAINAVPLSSTAYQHRDSGYVGQLYANTKGQWPGASGIAFVKGMVDSLGAEGKNLPAYAPYADTEFSRKEAQVRYWGDAVGKLQGIKKKWDRNGVIVNPQGF